jgi:hypothetical protein
MGRLVLILPLTLLASVASIGRSQPVTADACTYEQCAVRLQTGFFTEHLVRGDSGARAVRMSFTGRGVADYLSRVESAAVPAQQFQSRRTRGAVLGIISGAALFYMYESIANDDFGEDDFETGAIVGLTVGIPTAIWGAIETVRSRNALSEAIYRFNRAPVR